MVGPDYGGSIALARVQKSKVSWEAAIGNSNLEYPSPSQVSYWNLTKTWFKLVNFEELLFSITQCQKRRGYDKNILLLYRRSIGWLLRICLGASKLNRREAGQVKEIKKSSQKRKLGESQKSENITRKIQKLWENLWQEGSSWFRRKGK